MRYFTFYFLFVFFLSSCDFNLEKGSLENLSLLELSLPEEVQEGEAIALSYNESALALVKDLTIRYQIRHNETDADDFEGSLEGQLTSSESLSDLQILVREDSKYELSESFILELEVSSSSGEPLKTTKTIQIRQESLPRLSLVQQSFDETEGTVNLEFSLDKVSTVSTSFDLSTANGTASATVDFVLANQQIVIPPLQSSYNVALQIVDDGTIEGDETFQLVFANEENVDMALLQSEVTLVDDDKPQISIDDQIVNENAGSVSFNLSLSASSPVDISVDWSTLDSTAFSSSDYTGSSGTLVISSGSTTAQITVAITDDSLDEDNEVFSINLANPINVNISDGEGIGTINDEDPTPEISISSGVSLNEDSDHSYTLTLSAVSGRDVSFDVTTAGGTATAVSDYVVVNETLTIGAGATQRSFTVTINDDVVDEDSETYNVTLSSFVNVTNSSPMVTSTIVDNDDPPSMTINDVSANEGDDVVFTVSLSQASERSITVDYATANNTALSASDYSSSSGTLSFSPSETSKTITITTAQDLVSDPGETFFLNLSNGMQVTVLDNQGIGTLNQPDVTPPDNVTNFSSPGAWSQNGASPVFTWTVSGSGDVHHYEIEIRNHADDSSIQSWTDVGSSNTYQFSSGITMIDNQSYYANIRTVDTSGNTSGSLRVDTGGLNYWVFFEPTVIQEIFSGGSEHLGHSCALSEGIVKCWGANSAGQLGDGTTTDSATPIEVSGLTGVQSLALGGASTCALVNGGVKCWGSGGQGQLGNGSSINRSTPTDVTGLTSNVQAIAAGNFHACALTDGEVKCWGYNFDGQVGDGTMSTRSTPVSVAGITSASHIFSGGSSSCAIENGEAKCWGQNNNGQLGDGTTTDKLSPTLITALGSGVQNITLGDRHSCAVVNGGAKCWGSNNNGRLGDGTTTNRLTPVDVTGMSSGVKLITVGRANTCAIQNGVAKCWGYNYYGTNGNGSISSSSVPGPVDSMTSGVQQLVVGSYQACAIANGELSCWGRNDQGQSGMGSTTTRQTTPQSVLGYTSGLLSVRSSGNHSCAIVGGGVKCWGHNYYGQLGNGTNSPALQTSPVDVSGLSGVSQIAVGTSHSCAISNGQAYCWGANSFGQLGDTTTTDRLAPVSVNGLTGGVQNISLGGNHTCAVVDGAAQCWGRNSSGQLGDTTVVDKATPTGVSGLTTGVTKVSTGDNFSCALQNGAAKCWGYNGFSQLGDGLTTNASTPVDVVGHTSAVTDIATGFGHTCIVTSGAVKCLGRNSAGQLGDGTTTNRTAMVDTSGMSSGVLSIQARNSTTCALKNNGLYCWGFNNQGQVGNGATTDVSTPYHLSSLTGSLGAYSLGNFHVSSIVNGALKVWGRNNEGQLGDGTTTSQTSPIDGPSF